MTATHYNHKDIFFVEANNNFHHGSRYRTISAGMYRTSTYTSIEMPMFRTGLNTGR